MADGSESPDTMKFFSAAFPIDNEVYVLVKMHEGLPIMEIRHFVDKEGESLSLKSKLGVRFTRIGWDQLVVSSDDMLSIMNNPQTEDTREFVIEEGVLARPFIGLIIEMFDSEDKYSDIYLTAKQFTTLVKDLRENINEAFEGLKYE